MSASPAERKAGPVSIVRIEAAINAWREVYPPAPDGEVIYALDKPYKDGASLRQREGDKGVERSPAQQLARPEAEPWESRCRLPFGK